VLLMEWGGEVEEEVVATRQGDGPSSPKCPFALIMGSDCAEAWKGMSNDMGERDQG
jgi:hypothetical protein